MNGKPELEVWLCPIHQSLDDQGKLEPLDNCVACLRAERNELRELLVQGAGQRAAAGIRLARHASKDEALWLANEIKSFVPHVDVWGFDELYRRADFVAKAYLAAREPVLAESATFYPPDDRPHVNAYRSGCCHFMIHSGIDKFCPNCGRPIQWV